MSAKSASADFAKEEVKLDLTPMIDVAFLILIFFMCLPFKTLDGKLAAFLPTDKGMAPTPTKPPEPFWVKVHIVGRKDLPRPWGPDGKEQALMPSLVKYKIGNRETEDLEVVAAYIKKLKADWQTAGDAKLQGEIKAGHKVPHKYIIAVLNKFADVGVKSIDFFGTQIPKKKHLAMKYLPYPKKNYVTQD